MGLFDSVAGQVLGALSGGAQGQAQGGLLEAVGNLLHNYPGGLQGLVAAFEQQGLGGVIGSWVSTGQNLPISAEQIQSVLGGEQLQAMAQSLGFSTQDMSSQLAQFLPQIVDQLTPTGSLPEASPLGGLLDVLKGLER